MDDANAIFEGLGRLYYRRFGRLRPGKDEPAGSGRDSMDEDNCRQFRDWMRLDALDDAIRRIDALESAIESCNGEYCTAYRHV